ncbi:MAG TPA: polyketide synthase, partial [Legionella sp.]|nr:polyketide synthase [Legionella sp.]
TFPEAESINEFWSNIINGKKAISKAPLDRIDWSEFTAEEQGFTLDNKWGGFLANIDGFDPLFFGISPKEAEYMSPEQRLLLMHVWNTLENAGITPNTLAKEATGVFIAAGPSDYNHRKVYSPQTQLDNPGLMSSPSLSLIPNRISYFLDLHGPSEYCETACSSSLVALHRAVQSIQQGECSQAIIASVNLLLSPMSYLGLEAADMLSPTGTSRPFQQDADGLVKSEGVGALLIKSLAKAKADNDFIYAVIKGTGVAHGGKGISFTAPNVAGMKAAMIMAYKKASIDPSTVSYIETQGVGSSLADTAEISALKSGMADLMGRSPTKSKHPCYLGNIKPYMGHAEIFSGMASIIKVVLALRHQKIPAIPDFGQQNKNINLEDSSFKFAQENQHWDSDATTPRRASINGYGIGGVNAHIVLEEYIASEPDRANHSEKEPALIVLSAKNKEQLLMRAQLLHQFIDSSPNLLINDIAYTLQTGREAMPERAAFIVTSLNELQNALQLLCNTASTDPQRNWIFTGNIENQNAEIMALFSGQIGDTLLSLLYTSDKLEQIARFWTIGAAINWAILYQTANARRIPLPTYPFELRRCWLSSHRQKSSVTIPSSIPLKKDDIEPFIRSILSMQLGLVPEALNARTELQHYGLNSIMFVEITSRIRTQFPSFSPRQLTPKDTIESFTKKLNSMKHLPQISSRHPLHSTRYPELIHLNSIHQGQPIFWIHGGLGGVESYVAIAALVNRPFYAIQARGFMNHDKPIQGIPEMARYYIDLIKSVQPNGPYELGGFCLGGIISYEIARQLQRQEQQVLSIVMIDSPDNTSLNKAQMNNDNTVKNAALQVTNM